MLAGATDGFKAARSYLAQDAAAVWDPSVSVVVYQSGEAPGLSQTGTQLGRMTLTVTQVGEVDSVGRYTTQNPTQRSEVLQLSQDQDGEWRISELPDGSIIPEDVFQVDYLPAAIYFPSGDGQFLVPDRRVFPRQSAATESARQFLAGPPPYLTGAVGAVVPSGTRLATDAVKVTDGRATVNLSSAMARASESARATIRACLEATLTQLPDVTAVDLLIESVPLDAPAAAGLTHDPRSAGGPFYLTDAAVWLSDSGQTREVAGTEAAGAWETLAVDHTQKRFAGLRQGQIEVLAEGVLEPVIWEPPDGSGAPTAAPSFDRLGALWVAAGSVVTAFNADGEAAVLGAPWLEGWTVEALAASRDGSRLALALQAGGNGETRLVVTGIVRSEGAVPWRLTGPLDIARLAGPVTSLGWADGLTLAFLARPAGSDDPAPALLVVGGDIDFLKSPTDLPVALACGTGTDQLFASGKTGGLYAYSPRGRVWSSLAGGSKAVVLAP
jgi:hypothetical protein